MISRQESKQVGKRSILKSRRGNLLLIYMNTSIIKIFTASKIQLLKILKDHHFVDISSFALREVRTRPSYEHLSMSRHRLINALDRRICPVVALKGIIGGVTGVLRIGV